MGFLLSFWDNIKTLFSSSCNMLGETDVIPWDNNGLFELDSITISESIFEKDTITSIKNIVWATGYRPNFKWIEGLELDEDNYPKNYRGVSNIEGLYFIGLPWMFTRGSATLGGVSKDASYLADIISKRN